jgi:class 3 adenylate cyclase
MQRRGGSDQPVKRRRTIRRKARTAPTAGVSTTELQDQVAALTRELKEAREQHAATLARQTATSEILRTISSSPTEIGLVFDAILENAIRLCGGDVAVLWQFDGQVLRFAAGNNASSEAHLRAHPLKLGTYNPTALAGLEQRTVHELDVFANPAYRPLVPATTTQRPRSSTVLAVPLVREGKLFGVITIWRFEKRLFTDKQIELVKNFAAQAVIAIENARLLNELNKLNQQLEQRVTDQVSEIERMGRLRRFLPPQVADLIVASGTEKQLESHRREITALFCDLRGFTGFSESSDPEDVMALLREYHAAIGEIINTYGGTLERYAGDGVMVVFNDPIPVDNPALQAVLMAIDMRAAIGELIEKWRKLGHDIGFGIGIAHGFATLGTIGFEGRFDYAAIGTVSNVASRLCDEAKPGQILISPRVLMAVEKDITVEPVGDFALKGIRRPLAAYNVLATKAAD